MLAFEVNQWVTVFHETMSDSGSSLRLAFLVGLDAVEDALGSPGNSGRFKLPQLLNKVLASR